MVLIRSRWPARFVVYFRVFLLATFSFKFGLSVIQVSISSITIPPRTYGDLPKPWGFCILAFAQGQGFVGIAPEGGHLSLNDFCHFWNFHYNGKNWRLTTLWGLFVALKFCFKRKLFNLGLNQS